MCSVANILPLNVREAVAHLRQRHLHRLRAVRPEFILFAGDGLGKSCEAGLVAQLSEDLLLRVQARTPK